jgi:Outer membrane protein beta-barrel family/Carboxypeptidase regulatory-like domain
MRYLASLFVIFLFVQTGFAQTYTIKGSVTDTLNAAPLYRASVVLIRKSDSVIQSYTRTKPNGSFEISVPAKGKYVLRVTFPSFVDFTDVINVNKTVTDIGDLPMVSKEHLLKEFVLTKQVSAIKIKGDTTEYMADSFKVKENATVEDLLKRLPGIQVDKNGQITAQGETVQKILVDGEEFFSDDPKVVTQGLQANAVEKVQVYNKKSDQAEFTGIDDGQKTKTINLELKEDKKKGYFGKVDAGGGTDGYFQDQAMINAFKAKRQFSAFGIMSNTDKVGLGWQDNNKFGSGGNTVINEDGDMFNFSSSSDQDFGGWNGQYNGQGLPKTWTGGAHYADKWNGDKEHFTTNYRYAKQNVELDGNTTTQYVLPGNTGFVSQQNKNQFSQSEKHGLDAMFEWKLDSSTTIKLTADGGYKKSETKSIYQTNTFNNDNVLMNNNNRTITSDANAQYVNADLLLRKKFKKKGRTISIDVKENYKDSKSDGNLISGTDVFTADTLGHRDTTFVSADQKKTNRTHTFAFAAKATYTEPLSKTAFVEIDYGVTANNSTGLNYSYDKDSTGKFSTIPNNTFSSNFKYNILSNMGGLNFKFNYKTVNFSFGSDISNAHYLQTDVLHGDTSRSYNYVNLFPKANITYKIGKQTSLNFFYQGSTQQPSISQIQPLQQNTDPLNITLGNPSLTQEFINKFSLNFNDYKILTSRYLYGNFSFSTIADAISTRQTTSNGVSSTQFINVNGNYSGYGYFGGGVKLKKLDLMVGLHASTYLNHVNNIVTTIDPLTLKATDHKNSNDNNNYSIGPYFNYEKENKFEFELNPGITYNQNKSTISTFANSYWAFTTEFSGTIQLPKKFEIGTTVDVMMREKTVVFTDNNNVVKWNAFIGKKFLKKSQLELKMSVLDILNQNIGYSRTAQAGVITENNYNTIRRYGMLQLVWNFTHTPAGAPKQPEGGMIIMH